jgi:hypothetical protein
LIHEKQRHRCTERDGCNLDQEEASDPLAKPPEGASNAHRGGECNTSLVMSSMGSTEVKELVLMHARCGDKLDPSAASP